ncbi:alpha/beta-hydrolase [Microthyrium microscopicum]|uniref:Alpha/beta-hydrolase n=1 Tax=Microthyrium microscopicum TaxID=703497 RepID=A0A6A6UVD3_9PEZI|nr:alpha/beta-hydrolase [Microthyrium microscopicum]
MAFCLQMFSKDVMSNPTLINMLPVICEVNMYSFVVIGMITAGAAAQANSTARPCSPLEMVIARGTMESKPYGFLAASAIFTETKKLIPEVTGYSVDYPAAWGEESPKLGVADIKRYFRTQPKACPKQKYVLVGYSQGAVVQHRAAKEMTDDKANYPIFDRIIATVTFGDGGQQATKDKVYDSPVGPIPAWPAELDGRVKFNCNGKDLTCSPGGDSTLDHTMYTFVGTYITDSAKFVQTQYLKYKDT